ncbi:MAG TPA: PIG-L family deacetylase [Thermoanaerobaculia bacterium]|nr:PIG-L family deacetylase [Thermoanaerobaculia bacterium]
MRSGRARLLSLRFSALLLLLLGGGSGALPLPQPPPPARPGLDLVPTDRILVLAPHPDDEVLGCGGLLQRAVSLHLPVEVAFLTYGDSNEGSFLAYRLHPVLRSSSVEKMGEMRRREALAADALLGVPADRLTFLGYPDLGTLEIWQSHWAARPPGHGPLTRARAVPYPTALRPGAPYKGEEILTDLETVLARFRPTRICVSHPADRHPDHVALYLFTRVALWNLAGRVQATLYPYLLHFPGWPARGYQPAVPEGAPAALGTAVAWQSWGLTPAEVEAKRRALIAHRSQWHSGAHRLLPFARATELTGDFPPLTLPAGEGAALSVTGEGGLRLRLTRAGDRLRVELPPIPRLSLFAFGYRRDRPFGGIPKIEIRVEARSVAVLDQGKVLEKPGVTVERQTDRLVLGFPLALLGDPERLLLAARPPFGKGPSVRLPWRVIELGGG